MIPIGVLKENYFVNTVAPDLSSLNVPVPLKNTAVEKGKDKINCKSMMAKMIGSKLEEVVTSGRRRWEAPHHLPESIPTWFSYL